MTGLGERVALNGGKLTGARKTEVETTEVEGTGVERAGRWGGDEEVNRDCVDGSCSARWDAGGWEDGWL
jgi:hypothetical protein